MNNLKNIINEIKEITNDAETKNLIEMALKLTEETGEVAEAVLSHSNCGGCSYKDKDNNDVIEECCDVIIIALSTIFRAGGGYNDILDVINNKVEKWKSKIGK